MIQKIKHYILLTLITVGLLSCIGYALARLVIAFLTPYNTYDAVAAGILLLAESFILIHCIGYLLNVYSVESHSIREREPEALPLSTFPTVSVLVASYHEPIEIIEKNLICFYNLQYPNKQLFLLDDTNYEKISDTEGYKNSINELAKKYKVNIFRRPWRGAKAGIVNDFLSCLNSTLTSPYEILPFQGKEISKSKYVIIFDADMNPFPNFIEPLVEQLEADTNLAFIQTPQYYTNFETNRVARSSGLQQAVFYEYICEGKNQKNAMFCCGTNVMFRVEALESVGGFDESSVTEDFATSLKLHLRGWNSKYYNKVSAFGLGPEDLGAFFKQQYRWAFGTLAQLPRIIAAFIKKPNAMPMSLWWEYLLSSTHYYIGMIFFLLSMAPILYIFFGVPSIMAYPEIYLAFYLPYFMLTSLIFIFTLRQRKYKFLELNIALFLSPLTFPVYMRAAIFALLGKKEKFVVTPKSGRVSLPLKYLFPQLALSMLSFSAIIWAMHQLVYENENQPALYLNMIWCFYYSFVLSGCLHFNYSDES